MMQSLPLLVMFLLFSPKATKIVQRKGVTLMGWLGAKDTAKGHYYYWGTIFKAARSHFPENAARTFWFSGFAICTATNCLFRCAVNMLLKFIFEKDTEPLA